MAEIVELNRVSSSKVFPHKNPSPSAAADSFFSSFSSAKQGKGATRTTPVQVWTPDTKTSEGTVKPKAPAGSRLGLRSQTDDTASSEISSATMSCKVFVPSAVSKNSDGFAVPFRKGGANRGRK
eukprot:Amastigsp_a844115_116.p5 type:complete len:124 gc:universal Amastigsp_a844115_116:1518-1147(-)